MSLRPSPSSLRNVCASESSFRPCVAVSSGGVWYTSSRFFGCSSSTPSSAAVGFTDMPERTEPSDGAGDASRGGVCGFATENRLVRCEKNEPMPAPHELAAGFGSGGVFAPTRLSGRMPFTGAAGGCGDASGEGIALTESRAERMLAASDLDTSTALLEALLAGAPPEDELELRCIQRPRTLSTALKKPVDASVIVRETASRAGASC